MPARAPNEPGRREPPVAPAAKGYRPSRPRILGAMVDDAGYADTADENVLALGVGVAGHAGTSPHVSTAASTRFARRVAAPGVRHSFASGRPSCQTMSTPSQIAASNIVVRVVPPPSWHGNETTR